MYRVLAAIFIGLLAGSGLTWGLTSGMLEEERARAAILEERLAKANETIEGLRRAV